MKNQNNKVTAVLFVVALALAPMLQAMPEPQGGPGNVAIRNTPKGRARPAQAARPYRPANLSADAEAGGNGEARAFSASSSLPLATIYSTDNVVRGKTGTFVLHVKSTRMLGGTYVNFSVGGTAIEGVDYKVIVSPAYVSQSGYGVIQIETLANPRGSAFNQALSVEITLQAGAGYAVGKANSATMWIK